MTRSSPLRLRSGAATLALLALVACDPFDPDLRGTSGGFTTADAAQSVRTDRPQPDARGVISYPNYQVAVARTGDTITSVAARIGTDAEALGRFNGLPVDATLRDGEIIALPTRVAETPLDATNPDAPADVDVTTLAGSAIDAAPATPATPPPAAPTAEPIRHKVLRGETAYSVARLYSVSVRDLARWNGLGSQFAIREGQFLLIPVAGATPPPVETASTTTPGEGSPTPTPPSASEPLPRNSETTAAQPVAPNADLGAQTKPVAQGRLAFPVQGTVIRDYAKGRNEGIDLQAAPGTSVKAADAGTVAAITQSAEGVPIIVVRHAGNLLTVYANVTDVLVNKGDQVRRGQGLAKLRGGDQNFLHFEVREGFDSVDPNSYLN